MGRLSAASRAHRWSWLWLGGLSTFGALGTIWALAGAVALVVALAAGAQRNRSRVLGAAVGATAMQALLRLPDSHFFVFLPSTPYGLDTLTPTQRPGSKTR